MAVKTRIRPDDGRGRTGLRFPPAIGGGMLPPMAKRPDDSELMLRFGNGDLSAFEALYTRHKGPLYRYLLRHCGNEDTAGDLFQEVWGKIIKSRTDYQALAKFTTYLYHIAHNCLVDYYRYQGRRRQADHVEYDDSLPSDQVGPPRQPERLVASAQLADKLEQALASLPDDQREAFLLHEESGLSLEEIGRATGVGRETAKSRLRYALAKLRSLLAAEQATMIGTQL